jgi:hypothetical protein
MISFRLDNCTSEQDPSLEDDRAMPVAMKWHISDHFGLSRDGASGSVNVTVQVTLVLHRSRGVAELPLSLMVGSS